jgi:hypothetical protein
MKIVILITVIESFAVMSVYFHYRLSQSRKRVFVSRHRQSLLPSSKGN